MPAKKSLLVGAAIATVTLAGLGGAGLASAATDTTNTGNESIVDKIASKFNLSKTDVQAVFDEDRKTHQAERKAEQADRLAAAVSAGTLTQAQADYITKAQAEIEALHGTATPDTETDTVRQQIKTKIDALKKWAEDNKVDSKYILGGGHGPHGPGGPRDN